MLLTRMTKRMLSSWSMCSCEHIAYHGVGSILDLSMRRSANTFSLEQSPQQSSHVRYLEVEPLKPTDTRFV